MPNSYFRFKQFTIHQDACAMKVCTDSCLFGAWAADYLNRNHLSSENILDIGTGTGLLSLMLAQRLSVAKIDAIEIEPLCAQQAQTNILQSSWHSRIKVYNEDINQFASQKKYDVIICNPPFYESDLRSARPEKNMAHHNASLSLESLLQAAKKLITAQGFFAVLLPYRRVTEFENIAFEKGFHIHAKTLVKQTDRHPFFRVMLFFAQEERNGIEDVISIKNEHDQYSYKFISLLKDYYLHLEKEPS